MRWLAKWLKPGFGHVSVVVHIDSDVGIHVDGGMDMTRVNLIYGEVIPKSDQIVVPYVIDTTASDRQRVRLWRPANCVGMAKEVLGIRKWWVLTPYQLFKEVA